MHTLRALAEAYHVVIGAANRHAESLGLTPAQFDVVAVLGSEGVMTCRELGERSLITKGTLTGVLDRLEAKRLVLRSRGEQDFRQIEVRLTPEGVAVYQRIGQPHVDYLSTFFARVAPAHQAQLIERLEELKDAFLDA